LIPIKRAGAAAAYPARVLHRKGSAGMGLFQRWARNLDLMGRMFARTGALADARAIARAEAAFKGALMRCAGCGATEACQKFLDDESAGNRPPGFCANSALIGQLREARLNVTSV